MYFKVWLNAIPMLAALGLQYSIETTNHIVGNTHISNRIFADRKSIPYILCRSNASKDTVTPLKCVQMWDFKAYSCVKPRKWGPVIDLIVQTKYHSLNWKWDC